MLEELMRECRNWFKVPVRPRRPGRMTSIGVAAENTSTQTVLFANANFVVERVS